MSSWRALVWMARQTPTSLMATKYSVAFVVDTFKRRSCERKREARALTTEKQTALLQLFSPAASVALMRMPRVLTIAIKTAITVSPYLYAVACVWS